MTVSLDSYQGPKDLAKNVGGYKREQGIRKNSHMLFTRRSVDKSNWLLRLPTSLVSDILTDLDDVLLSTIFLHSRGIFIENYYYMSGGTKHDQSIDQSINQSSAMKNGKKNKRKSV